VRDLRQALEEVIEAGGSFAPPSTSICWRTDMQIISDARIRPMGGAAGRAMQLIESQVRGLTGRGQNRLAGRRQCHGHRRRVRQGTSGGRSANAPRNPVAATGGGRRSRNKMHMADGAAIRASCSRRCAPREIRRGRCAQGSSRRNRRVTLKNALPEGALEGARAGRSGARGAH